MALKKKRGRPRKHPLKKTESSNPPAADTAKPSSVLESASKAADDLTGVVRKMFSKPPEPISSPQAPAAEQQNQSVDSSMMSQTSSQENSSVDTSQLEETVNQVKERFGPAPSEPAQSGAPGTGPEPAQAPQPEPTFDPPDHNFVPEATVRAILESAFSSASKRHGAHWQLSPDESRSLTPITVDMVNEQGPRLFGESQNRALFIWVAVMGVFIAVRSEAGARLIEWIMDKITGVKQPAAQPKPQQQKADAKKDSTPSEAAPTTAASLAFSDSSGFQVPARQP
ncbi:MAG TPA: hypothetical protein VFB79_21410 [Candidatus Angelobacter sp.]|nr:hypothetical protein [Candidatus Angelobacter sp.]